MPKKKGSNSNKQNKKRNQNPVDDFEECDDLKSPPSKRQKNMQTPSSRRHSTRVVERKSLVEVDKQNNDNEDDSDDDDDHDDDNHDDDEEDQDDDIDDNDNNNDKNSTVANENDDDDDDQEQDDIDDDDNNNSRNDNANVNTNTNKQDLSTDYMQFGILNMLLNKFNKMIHVSNYKFSFVQFYQEFVVYFLNINHYLKCEMNGREWMMPPYIVERIVDWIIATIV